MKTLNLTLKKKWFDMIASGEKKEEYREAKTYWMRRLFTKKQLDHIDECTMEHGACFHDVYPEDFKHFDYVSANNGYAKNCPNVTWEHKGIRIGKPNPALV